MRNIFKVWLYCFILGLICVGLMKCNNNKEVKTDYQINLHGDTVFVFDGERYVGKIVSLYNSPLDSLLLNDNQ